MTPQKRTPHSTQENNNDDINFNKDLINLKRENNFYHSLASEYNKREAKIIVSPSTNKSNGINPKNNPSIHLYIL